MSGMPLPWAGGVRYWRALPAEAAFEWGQEAW